MKYMTFNSSCSYAGVANMLAQYGVDADDRSIAMGMQLPYLFSHKDGVYLAGPMLQSAQWFNLYLHPIGFEMTEKNIPAEQVPEYLKQWRTAMLGLQVDESEKHAVVYTGSHDGELVFLNNKWEHTDAPEQIKLTEEELIDQIGSSAMIATLKPTSPKTVDLTSRLISSQAVIRQNLEEIRELSSREEKVSVLRSKRNALFRPLLLDGITMLNLLQKTALACRFAALQASFVSVLKADPSKQIKLGDYLDITELMAASERYIVLIEQNL